MQCCNVPILLPTTYYKNKDITKVTEFYCSRCGQFTCMPSARDELKNKEKCHAVDQQDSGIERF